MQQSPDHTGGLRAHPARCAWEKAAISTSFLGVVSIEDHSSAIVSTIARPLHDRLDGPRCESPFRRQNGRFARRPPLCPGLFTVLIIPSAVSSSSSTRSIAAHHLSSALSPFASCTRLLACLQCLSAYLAPTEVHHSCWPALPPLRRANRDPGEAQKKRRNETVLGPPVASHAMDM